MRLLITIFNPNSKVICNINPNILNVVTTKHYNGDMYYFGKEYQSENDYVTLGSIQCSLESFDDLFLFINLDEINEQDINYNKIHTYISSKFVKYADILKVDILREIQSIYPYILFIGLTDQFSLDISVHYNEDKNIDSILILNI